MTTPVTGGLTPAAANGAGGSRPPSGPWSPRQGYQRAGATLPQAPARPSRSRRGRTDSSQTVPSLSRGTYAQVPGLPADWAGQVDGEVPRYLSSGRRWRRVVYYALVGFGAAGLVGLLWLVSLSSSDASDVALGVLLATVPLLVVLAVVLWIARWEPQPRRTLTAAFLWGAGVSAGVSAAVNTWVQTASTTALGDAEQAQALAMVVSAPLVEEATKGLGVLVIFLVWRRVINGPVDGLVYGAVIAAGFAFSENILYFISGRSVLLELFVARGVFSPFAHVTFTGCTGVALGFSARRRSRLAWVWWMPAGLIPAVVLHAFWNGVVARNPIYYLIIEVPLFIVCIALVVWLRWSERTTMRRRLDEYGRAGWFAYPEVMMLTTAAGRSAARRWARSRGPVAVEAMNSFQEAASRLAQLRQQAAAGHAAPDHTSRENALLTQITQARQVFLRGG